MTILFAGGEEGDFTKIGICSVDTATTTRRNATRARCSLKLGGSSNASDGWVANFTPSSTFWVTGNVFFDINTVSLNWEWLAFLDGANRRLTLRGSASGNLWKLSTRNNAGTYVDLITSGTALPMGALMKVDVSITYAVAGSIIVYFDGTPVLSYSGNITTDSATTLSAVCFGPYMSFSQSTYWSEIIVSTTDTRSMRLVTLPCAAVGNTTSWSGGTTVSNINETTQDDATLISSGTANQVNEFTVTSSGLTGNPGITALVVTARAAKGTSGPANAQMMVRTSSTDYTSSNIALSESLTTILNAWETNPSSGAAWILTDLTAPGFNVGIKSIT